MSRYTTQIRWICEMNSGFDYDKLNEGYYSANEIIDASIPKIFNFSFPLYDEEHRTDLCRKILKHYYTREICAETFELWRLWLDDRLNLIMPKYNELYRAEKLKFDNYLINIDVTTKNSNLHNYNDTTDSTHVKNYGHTTNTNQQTDITTTNKSDVRTAHSDTPQGGISQIDNLSYLTDYTRVYNTGTNGNGGEETHTTGAYNTNKIGEVQSGKDTDNDNKISGGQASDDFNGKEKGYRCGKTYGELLKDYQDSVLNIDEMIVNDLNILFFKLW